MSKTYVFFSEATDVTGNVLKEKLNAAGGKEMPKTKPDIVLSWGAKTSKDVTFDNGVVVLNHPNAIRKNRNKYQALQLMEKAKVPVGKFVESESVINSINSKTVSLPLVGRTKYHQGGKNFWLCLTKTHVQEAIKQGAQYFQEYLSIVKEYRMHVFKDEAFYASVKTQSANPQKSYVESHAEKIKNSAEKNGHKIDAKTVEFTLAKIADRNQHSNPILKSHAEGWVFKSVGTTELKTNTVIELSKVAVAAVKAVGLDFGAVDCGVDEDGKVFVIEVNTGPSLEGTSLEKWLWQITEYIKKLDKPKEKENKKVTPATKQVVTATMSLTNKRDNAIRKAELLKDLLMSAEENEMDSIMSAAARMFNSEAKGAAKVFSEG